MFLAPPKSSETYRCSRVRATARMWCGQVWSPGRTQLIAWCGFVWVLMLAAWHAMRCEPPSPIPFDSMTLNSISVASPPTLPPLDRKSSPALPPPRSGRGFDSISNRPDAGLAATSLRPGQSSGASTSKPLTGMGQGLASISNRPDAGLAATSLRPGPSSGASTSRPLTGMWTLRDAAMGSAPSARIPRPIDVHPAPSTFAAEHLADRR